RVARATAVVVLVDAALRVGGDAGIEGLIRTADDVYEPPLGSGSTRHEFHDRLFRVKRSSWFVAIAMFAAGCSGSNRPQVELMENGVYRPEKVRSYSISGARDGATTHATGTFLMADGDHIQIELDVSYNPTPELASGRWQRDGHVRGAGPVQAESLKFLGGQGAPPSVGGRFRLDQEGSPLMRVTMPAQPLERPAP